MGRMRVLLMCGVIATLFLLGCSSGGGGGGSGSSLVLMQAAPPDGMVGSFYWFAFTATGGTKPYTWSVTDGTLPSGLTLDSAKGTLSGTPTAADTYNFRLTVTDSGSPQQTASRWFSITILPSGSAALQITTTSLPDAVQGENYSASLTAIGGTPPYNWTISSGALPSGLNLDGVTGEIHGTPTSSGTFSFTVTVTDASSNTASSSFSITVSSASLPPLPSPIQLAQGDFAYSHTVTVGENFTVNAEENPSTGHTWLLESYDTSYLELVNNQYEPPPGNSSPGTPGERHFTFKALKAGQTQIVMVYKRPWENDYYTRVTIEITIK